MFTKKVTRTETAEVVPSNRPKAAAYSAYDQFIYLIFGIIEALLALRFVFRLAGANPASGFIQFLYRITNVLMVPFRFIFPTQVAEGAIFEWSVLVAMAIYALFAWVIMKLIAILYTADSS